MKIYKSNKAITLIALIITIVVLLILAVVAINSVQEGGILSHAKDAQQTYKDAADNETTQLQNYTDYLSYYSTIENGWKQNGVGSKENPNIEITFTKGEEKVKLGDTVNYQTVGYEGTYTGQWKVLGMENGQLLLVSASVLTDAFSTEGTLDYDNSGSRLTTEVCSKYLNTDYATEARSIKIEDINRITGYDPTTYSGYGDKWIYKDNSEDNTHLTYRKNYEAEQTYALVPGPGPSQFHLPNGMNWNEEGWSGEFVNTSYYYNIGDYNATLKTMLEGKPFYVESRSVHAQEYAVYAGLRTIDAYGTVGMCHLWTSGFGYGYGVANVSFVRPVVLLKPDVQLIKNGENSWNIQ